MKCVYVRTDLCMKLHTELGRLWYPMKIIDSSFRQPRTQGIIAAPVALPFRKYSGGSWSGDTKNSAVFSISVIKHIARYGKGSIVAIAKI